MLVTPEIPFRSGVDCSFVTRIVLVHGSVGNAEAAFGHLVPALSERFEVVLHTRGGYPPRPPEERIDFEEQADELAAELRDGDHLVGHSYGAVVSLLAAARTDAQLASLVVSEPPAFGLARDDPAVAAFLDGYAQVSRESPEVFAAEFLALVGSTTPPGRLAPALEAGVRAAMVERTPDQAVIPLDELAAAPFPKLVISGAHHAAFDAVADVLEQRLGAERAVLPGAGHSLPRAPGYLETIVAFVERA
jgi:pimeloyl-ACP methyl ester carboxylesterase